MTSAYDELLKRLRDAFDAIEEGADPVLRRSDRSDFQANGVMGLAKKVGRSPREVADEVVASLNLEGIATVEVAGPGFLNISLEGNFLDAKLNELLSDERIGIPSAAVPLRVVIDYSAPNVAKEMHVGHLRSTVIGDALARMYDFSGHDVMRQNHVGDWGTPFGMLIEHLLDLGEDQAIATLSIGDLDGFYREARKKFESDDVFKARSRERVAILQIGHDPDTERYWRMLVEESTKYFSDVYEKLDVRLTSEDIAGESKYNPYLANLMFELLEKGLILSNDDAYFAWPKGFKNRDGDPLPLIIQKRGEAFGYAATDLAALRYRVDELKADELLYVVGAPQSLHFEMVFSLAREAGWLPNRVRCEHVVFGNVLGSDHKMFKSRGGETVKLLNLLDEATAKAYETLERRETGLNENDRLQLATQVARAAIKYADLSTERQHDYVFDLERMITFEGDTGPYLQYAHARVRSIFRRLGSPWEAAATSFALAAPQERELAMGLLALPEAYAAALASLQPHRLCTYLFDLAQRFTSFYDACPVLSAQGALRDERLALCDLTARTLSLGLSVLGIDAPDQM